MREPRRLLVQHLIRAAAQRAISTITEASRAQRATRTARTSSAASSTYSASVLIAQITDLHVVAEGPGRGLVDTAAHLAAAARCLNGMRRRPDAVVVTGDLVEDATIDEYRRLDPLLGSIEAPLYLLPGNHDDPSAMAAAFPDHTYLRSTPGGTFDFVVDLGEVVLVALDTTVRGEAHGALGVTQLEWLDATLERLAAKPVLIAMHHPPFETGIWWMDAMGLEGAAEFAEVIGRHANARRVICGHIHRSVTATIGGAIVSVAPSTGQQIRLDLDGSGAGFTDEQSQLTLHLWDGGGWVSHETAFRVEREIDITKQYPGFDQVAAALHAAGPSARKPAPTDR
jgi:3',5'-cyclic AMP phosphodiesterase CpdA